MHKGEKMGKQQMVSISKKELRRLESRVKAEQAKKAKKAARKVDGLGPHLEQKIRSALREVWHRSEARKLVVARTALANGYARCEHAECKGKRYPKIYIDHVVNVGAVDEGFIKRMFVPSSKLQGLCKKHHDEKTKAERASKKKTVTKKAKPIDDFF